MTLAWVATCVFFLGVAPAGGARTKKSNDATALHNVEAQAEKVERLRASLAAGLKAEVAESGRRLTRSKLLARRPHSGGHWLGKKTE